jgi:hypothetical protein
VCLWEVLPGTLTHSASFDTPVVGVDLNPICILHFAIFLLFFSLLFFFTSPDACSPSFSNLHNEASHNILTHDLSTIWCYVQMKASMHPLNPTICLVSLVDEEPVRSGCHQMFDDLKVLNPRHVVLMCMLYS